MRRVFLGLIVAGLCVCVCIAKPSFAIKPISDVFVATYAGEKAPAAFQKLVKDDAKCNVCHIADKTNKKEFRNPYGAALKEELKAVGGFAVADLKKAPKDEKLVGLIKDAMKKLEGKKAKDAGADAKTFGARIKEGMLPGGDKDGK